MLQLEGVLIPELRCKYLTLQLHMEKFDLYGVDGLLQASPHLQTLNIDMATTKVTYLELFLLFLHSHFIHPVLLSCF